ncbi:hypothetical protein JZ751_021429 [Albula glossodonta]|uniref:Uncharacterized protein n=1 Tax=Albula glossodonta TaxID=121402 RepID=A0A8T2MRE1_9TELE|nr:hypothetical protein JZ751_021429 [Albula glossodonta]
MDEGFGGHQGLVVGFWRAQDHWDRTGLEGVAPQLLGDVVCPIGVLEGQVEEAARNGGEELPVTQDEVIVIWVAGGSPWHQFAVRHKDVGVSARSVGGGALQGKPQPFLARRSGEVEGQVGPATLQLVVVEDHHVRAGECGLVVRQEAAVGHPVLVPAQISSQGVPKTECCEKCIGSQILMDRRMEG